jgi:hypothetical protein
MVYQVFARDVTIPAGSSTSDPIPITGLILVGISIPAGINANRLALQVRPTSADPFRMLRNASGPVYAGITGNSFAVYPNDIMQLLLPFDAIRIVTLDSSNNQVNQTSDVTLRVFLAPM